MSTSDFIQSLSFSSLYSCLSFFKFRFLVTVLVFHIHCLVITNTNFLLVRLQSWLLKKTKQDGGLRRDVSCSLTEKIEATLQDKWCATMFAVTSLGKE